MKKCIHDKLFKGRTQECIIDGFFDDPENSDDCEGCPINDLVKMAEKSERHQNEKRLSNMRPPNRPVHSYHAHGRPKDRGIG